MLREAGRQGVLPFATFWTRVGQFKTPYGPLLLKWCLSAFLVIAVPAGDTFAFLVDLSGYPGLVSYVWDNGETWGSPITVRFSRWRRRVVFGF